MTSPSATLGPYEIDGPHGPDFHRPLSAYLNAVVGLGCGIVEVAEPGLDPAVATAGPDGATAYVDLPNFLVVAARRVPATAAG